MHSSLRFARLENACTHAVLVRARVKCRTVILGSLAEVWHCSREYRVERSRLLGASSHTNPSPRFRSRSILALVYVCLSFFCSLSYSYATTYSLPMLHRRRVFFSSQNLLLFFSLKVVPFFSLLFLFLPSMALEALELSSSVFICAIYWFLFFVLTLLFLTRYIFKCISLYLSKKKKFFYNTTNFSFSFFFLPYFDIFLYHVFSASLISICIHNSFILLTLLIFRSPFLVKEPSSFVMFCFLTFLSSFVSVHARCYFFVFSPLLRRGRVKGSQIFILCNLAM